MTTISTDTDRLNWIERHQPTFYKNCITFYLDNDKAQRQGLPGCGHYAAMGASLRERIDNAMAGNARKI